MIQAGVKKDLAQYLWAELQPYYFAPLAPDPVDHVYGDMRIDPDDLNDIALEFEKRFGVKLRGNPIECPHDPTVAEFAVALQRASD